MHKATLFLSKNSVKSFSDDSLWFSENGIGNVQHTYNESVSPAKYPIMMYILSYILLDVGYLAETFIESDFQ